MAWPLQSQDEMKLIFTALAIFLPMLFVAATAQAWGPLGHRSSALVADSLLTPRSRQAVKAILGEEKLVDTAMWADNIRNLPPFQHTAAYHYENIADGQTYEASLRALPRELRAQGGAVTAILQCEAALRDPRVDMNVKKTALKLLVHFVADLHQPLHTGRPEDRGGNDIRVRWGTRTTSLHALWDGQLITTIHADIAKDDSEDAQPAVELARRLAAGVARSPMLKQRKPGDVLAWLNESLDLRRLAYDPRVTAAPEAYLEAVRPSLEAQLYLSGARTAEILNRVFGGRPWTNDDIRTRSMIESILSRLDSFVFVGLKPKI